MKLTKTNLKGIAAAAVFAGTMAIAPVSALAVANNPTYVGDQTLVTKQWDVASNSQLNNDETFTFQISYDGAEQVGTWDVATLNFQTRTVDLTADWATLADGGTSASASLTARQLFGDTNFYNPGIYTFTVKEIAGSNPNITYSGTEYTVKVNVSMPDDYPAGKQTVIRSVKVYDSDGTKVGDTATFENTESENESLNISKTVAGTAANTADTFTYTLDLEGVKGNYAYEIKSGSTSISTGEISSGQTFTLKHGQTIEIKNLPKGATYTVTESDTEYDETNTVNDVASTDGHVASGTIAATNNVAFKNEKGFAPDTGITMNTLPFVTVGIVAAVGGATLVISRRRRSSGEDF